MSTDFVCGAKSILLRRRRFGLIKTYLLPSSSCQSPHLSSCLDDLGEPLLGPFPMQHLRLAAGSTRLVAICGFSWGTNGESHKVLRPSLRATLDVCRICSTDDPCALVYVPPCALFPHACGSADVTAYGRGDRNTCPATAFERAIVCCADGLLRPGIPPVPALPSNDGWIELRSLPTTFNGDRLNVAQPEMRVG